MKKVFLMLMAVGMMASCATKDAKQAGLSQVNRADFQAEVDGKQVDLYTLKNANGLEMTVTNFGGRVVEIFTPDRDGNYADIVLGHETLDQYVNYDGERFLGATIGRYGNRIKDGKFTLVTDDGIAIRFAEKTFIKGSSLRTADYHGQIVILLDVAAKENIFGNVLVIAIKPDHRNFFFCAETFKLSKPRLQRARKTFCLVTFLSNERRQ